MDTAALDELRALRARAYGPHADIDQDPAAMRRLSELENLRGAVAPAAAGPSVAPAAKPSAPRADPPMHPATQAAPVPGPAESVAPAAESAAEPVPFPPADGQERLPGDDAPSDAAPSDAAPSDAAPADAAPAASAAPAAADAAPAASAAPAAADAVPAAGAAEPSTAQPKRRISRTVAVLWALSLVATAAIAAGLTYAATWMAPVSTSSGAPQIATLESTSLTDVPAGWFGAGPSSRAFEFYGLTLFESAQGYGVAGSDCFTVLATEQIPPEVDDANGWSINTPVYSGCRVGDFPAAVQFSIDSNAPQELRDRYPDGTSLQFVFDGDRIGVFLDRE